VRRRPGLHDGLPSSLSGPTGYRLAGLYRGRRQNPALSAPRDLLGLRHHAQMQKSKDWAEVSGSSLIRAAHSPAALW
jgi:hypothetical protein